MFTISENKGIKPTTKKGFYSGNKYIKKRLYKNNNWKAIQGNSIKVLYNGLKRIKHKKPSSLKVYHKLNANTFMHIMTGEKIIIK